jgi:hypothetical protein
MWIGKPTSYCAHRNHTNLAVGGRVRPHRTLPHFFAVRSLRPLAKPFAIHQKRHELYIDEKQIVILNVDEIRVLHLFL